MEVFYTTWDIWVLVDLEGTKEIKKVMLALHGVVNTVYEIALTNDRKEFRNIYISKKGDANDYITVSLNNEKAPYVRVKFPDSIEGICGINIMA